MWDYTPKQIRAWLFLKFKRLKREATLGLNVATLGARGDIKEVRKTAKKWMKGDDG